MSSSRVLDKCSGCNHTKVCSNKETVQQARDAVEKLLTAVEGDIGARNYDLVNAMQKCGITVRIDCENYCL